MSVIRRKSNGHPTRLLDGISQAVPREVSRGSVPCVESVGQDALSSDRSKDGKIAFASKWWMKKRVGWLREKTKDVGTN